MSKTLHLKPRMSEKTYALSLANNVFVFDVPLSTNKVEIARAVEAQFGVTVTTVRIIILKGKQARSIRIGSKARANVTGRRSDTKKAYVTLKEGDSIPVFAALDEQNKAEEKAAEKEAKKAKKETK
jgi:large subunit ribosomal protein L23